MARIFLGKLFLKFYNEKSSLMSEDKQELQPANYDYALMQKRV